MSQSTNTVALYPHVHDKVNADFRNHEFNIKGTLSGPRQFLQTGSPLKIMRIGLYFTLKALFVL